MKTIHTLPFLLLFVFYNSSFAQDPNRFADEVTEITERYQSHSNPDHVIVFTGSSSIKLWKDIGEYFPEENILNTGFGGSQMSDLIYYIEELVIQYKPEKVFVYEGDNDLASDKTPEEVLNDAKKLVSIINEKLPGTKIIFISAKPSPSRWSLQKQYKKYNSLIEKYAAKNDGIEYANIWDTMLNENKKPKPEIFLEDELHMNKAGYDLWGKEIGKYLN